MPESQLGGVPDSTPANIAALLRSATMYNDELLLVLDLDRVLHIGDNEGAG